MTQLGLCVGANQAVRLRQGEPPLLLFLRAHPGDGVDEHGVVQIVGGRLMGHDRSVGKQVLVITQCFTSVHIEGKQVLVISQCFMSVHIEGKQVLVISQCFILCLFISRVNRCW